MMEKRSTKVGVAVAVAAACLATFYGVQAYALHVADADLASAIFGNMDACKTAPVGEWQKASDFPKSE